MCLFSLYSTIWGGRFNHISLFKGKSIEKWKPCEVYMMLGNCDGIMKKCLKKSKDLGFEKIRSQCGC
jgi:hypothetical protein